MPRKTTLYANAPELANVGQAIRRARKAKGISQEALALATEIERSYFGGLERGQVNFTFMYLVRIARELGMPVHELVRDAAV